jgi:hypothetical protein
MYINIEALVEDIEDLRREFGDRYDVTNPDSDHFNYSSLCDGATLFILDRIKKRYSNVKGLNIKGKICHGELKHYPKIPSLYWNFQHTWLRLDINSESIYIDITCKQFQYICNEIPDYYISIFPPPWFIEDNDNIFIKIYKFNPKIAIIYAQTVIRIWAHISDIIGAHPYNKL